MNNPQNQNGPPFQESREDFKRVVGVAQIVSGMLPVWLRRFGTWEDRYASFQMALSWIFMLLFGPLFFPHYPPRPMLIFFGLTTLLLLIHRGRGIQLRLRGYQCHSRYSGRSRIPGDEVRAKTTKEPLFVIGAGLACLAFNLVPLGAYLLIAAVCHAFSCGIQAAADNARIRAARDAMLEARWLAGRLRDEL
jgi:hypothetical protein